MNVLSCFDGISCGQLALERANINIDKYYASEIDKHAITVTQKNYPDTIQLGDITKWREWDIDWSKIDLLIGGSPCFVAETKILTETGYKNIDEIRVGENVLTHKNRFRKVLRTGGKLSFVYELKLNSQNSIYVTANHPFYVKESRESEPVWKAVKDLKPTDCLMMHSNKIIFNIIGTISFNIKNPFFIFFHKRSFTIIFTCHNII